MTSPLPADLAKYHFFARLKALPFVEAIYLYGSRARGEADEWSDVDLAVLCPRADSKDWAQVRDILEQADTLLEIDCVRLDTASAEFRENILRESVVLYERPTQTA